MIVFNAEWFLQVLTKNGADKSLILKAIDMKRHITKVKEKVGKVKIVKSANQTFGKASVSIESKDNLFLFVVSLHMWGEITLTFQALSTNCKIKGRKLIENNFTQGILILTHPFTNYALKVEKTVTVILKMFRKKKDLNPEFPIIWERNMVLLAR